MTSNICEDTQSETVEANVFSTLDQPALAASAAPSHWHQPEPTSSRAAAHSSLEEQLWLNLARAASVAGHGVEVGLRPHGLSPTQLSVLRILREAGQHGLCQYQIGERLVAQMPDVPRILDRMERAGWVERERGTVDRRRVMASLTERGLALAAEVDGIVESLTSRMFRRLSPTDLGKLNELLTLALDTALSPTVEQQH